MRSGIKWFVLAAILGLTLQGCSSDDDEAIQIVTVTGNIRGYDYVDLGLPSGLLWATCNIGATSSSEYGDFFAWGETETKSEYLESNSVTYGIEMFDISGDSDYDAARDNWGDTWRMPTADEILELRNKCQWEWTTYDDHNGYRVVGPNGNSLFLPAAGWCDGSMHYNAEERGNYWSSTPYVNDSCGTYYLGFDSQRLTWSWTPSREMGRSIRPVSEYPVTGFPALE